MGKKLCVKLTSKERSDLERFCDTVGSSTRLARRAQLILALDSSDDRNPDRNAAIARRAGVSRQTLNTVRHDFLNAKDVPTFLQRKKRTTRSVAPKIDDKTEARIIELARGDPPEGHSRWSLRLLATKCVELRVCNSMSHTTISRLLKKQNPGHA